MRTAEGKVIATIAVFALAIVALAAAALAPADRAPAGIGAIEPAATHDAATERQAQLRHCQDLGEAGPRDAACRRLWADSRAHFLGRESATPTGR